MVEVTKSILISGAYDMEYLVRSDNPNYIAVYAKADINDEFDYDSPLLYLNKAEGLAESRAISELLTGY